MGGHLWYAGFSQEDFLVASEIMKICEKNIYKFGLVSFIIFIESIWYTLPSI